MKSLYLGASMLAIAAAAIVPASAADMYRGDMGGYKDGPAYVAVSNWAGFYAGINGGYGWSEFNDQLACPRCNQGLNGVSPSGGFGGAQIGYNWQAPGSHLVFGIEADIQGGDISATAKDNFADVFSSRLDWFGTLRGRLGYAFDRTLIYATGGFAYGGIRNTADFGSDETWKASRTATGYVVGGGVEYSVNPAWSLKAEYQYINLGKNDLTNPTFPSDPYSSFATVHDDAFHTVRVGLNYHVAPSYEPLK